MSEVASAHQQPDFIWIPEKGHAIPPLSSKRRKAKATARSTRVSIFYWGVTFDIADQLISANWADIAAVWQASTRTTVNGVHTSTSYAYVLKLTDGRTLSFRGGLSAGAARQSEAAQLQPVPGAAKPVTIEQFGRILATAVTGTQLPGAMDRFRSGQTVSFGPLAVSLAGISAGDQSVPWSQIQDVRTANGKVSVKQAGKWLAWHSAPIGQIPNYFVFKALVRSVLDQRSSGPG
jgi:hypothetical protein